VVGERVSSRSVDQRNESHYIVFQTWIVTACQAWMNTCQYGSGKDSPAMTSREFSWCRTLDRKMANASIDKETFFFFSNLFSERNVIRSLDFNCMISGSDKSGFDSYAVMLIPGYTTLGERRMDLNCDSNTRAVKQEFARMISACPL
jgi:hypothetical protein